MRSTVLVISSMQQFNKYPLPFLLLLLRLLRKPSGVSKKTTSVEPAVRYVYSMDPPVPGFVFGLGYYMVAAVSLILLTVVATMLYDKINGGIWRELIQRNQEEEKEDLLFLQGGFELRTYLFVGNAYQVIGLKTIPSDRTVFLLQLTTIQFR